jgi:hypothetical protein
MSLTVYPWVTGFFRPAQPGGLKPRDADNIGQKHTWAPTCDGCHSDHIHPADPAAESPKRQHRFPLKNKPPFTKKAHLSPGWHCFRAHDSADAGPHGTGYSVARGPACGLARAAAARSRPTAIQRPMSERSAPAAMHSSAICR